MALYGPYATGGTYWRFYYEIIDASRTGNTHNLQIKFYLAHNGGGNYYSGAQWNFNYTINGVDKTYQFSGSGTVANSKDYSAKTQIGATQYLSVKSPNALVDTAISVKASMSERAGSVSPHRSNGGSGKFTLIDTATAISSGSLTLTDNGDNTVTISGKLGKNGTNNNVVGSTLYWTTNGNNPKSGTKYTSSQSMGSTAGGSFSKKINVTNANTSNNTMTVKALIYTNGEYGYGDAGLKTLTAKWYSSPKAPGKPILHFSTSKPTINKEVYFEWTAATALSKNSPVVGYRLRLQKNDVLVNLTSLGYLDTESTSRTYEFVAKDFGFVSGDKVKLGVYSYSKLPNGTQLFNGGGSTATQVWSDEYTFGSAGIMRININGAWKEGQVWIKVQGVWKEAEAVYINKNGSWKESQ